MVDVNYLSGHGEIYENYTIVTMDSGVLMAGGIMLSLVCALAMCRKKMKGFIVILLALLPMAFAIAFSFRRAHWIGQIVALAVLYLLTPRELRKKMVLSVLACAFLTVCTYVAVTGYLVASRENGPRMLSRIETLIDPNQHSNKHHYLESVTTLQDILQKPLLGMGLGGMHSPVSENIIDWPEESQPVHIVHNTFLFIWMKLGLPGLCFFLWIGVAYLKKLNAYRKSTDHTLAWPYIAGIGSGVGIWFMMFFTSAVPWCLHQTFLIALFAAMALNLIRQEESNGKIDNLKSGGLTAARAVASWGK
jgi:O-antigen ligase